MKKTLSWIFFGIVLIYDSPLRALDVYVDPTFLKKNPGTKITMSEGVGNGCVSCNSPELKANQRARLKLNGEKKFIIERHKQEVWLVINGRTIWTRHPVYICDSNEIVELIPSTESAEIIFKDGKKASIDHVGNVNCLTDDFIKK